jgi:SAM-dependent methyltransferase
MSSAHWDERFAGSEYLYGLEPNDFLRAEADRIPAGPVLSLGEGEGRNAAFVGALGHAVTAVDYSLVGLRKAERLAHERGVTLTTIHADLADYQPPAAQFSGVLCIFAHLPAEVRRPLFARAGRALVTGGCFLLEAYRPEQLAHGTGGPKDVRLLPTLAELREELAALDLVIAREVERDVYEGRLHGGRSATVQIAGIRRA